MLYYADTQRDAVYHNRKHMIFDAILCWPSLSKNYKFALYYIMSTITDIDVSLLSDPTREQGGNEKE